MTTLLDAIVIGGGLSGLVAAYRLQKKGMNFKLVEASARLGGLIHSERDHGYLWEAGPHTFPGSATELLALCNELGLQPQAAQGRKRYLYLHQQLTDLPMSPVQAITTPVLSLKGKLRLLREPWIPPCQAEDISVADFVRYRFGDEVADNLLDPFISGIYAGNIETLSLPAVFPKLWQWEQQSGSVIQGLLKARKSKQVSSASNQGDPSDTTKPKGLLSFAEGLQTFTNALVKRIASKNQILGNGVAFIQREAGHYQVHLQNGEWLHAKALILATPAYQSAALLTTISSEASTLLWKIEYNDLAVLHLGFDHTQIAHPLDGFGCLIPRKERLPLLGTIWASTLFPGRTPEGKVLLTNLIGGAHHPEILNWSPQQIEDQVLADLEKVFGMKYSLIPEFSKLLMYKQAIPQYQLGHKPRIAQLERCLEGSQLYLAGNYLHGIGLNECVKSAEDAVLKAFS